MDVTWVGPIGEWDKVDVKDPDTTSPHLIRVIRRPDLTNLGTKTKRQKDKKTKRQKDKQKKKTKRQESKGFQAYFTEPR